MNTSIARWSFPSIVFLAAFAILPAFASAATSQVTTQTVQLLPTGSQTCAPLSITSVTPYVYDGSLDSFDIVTPDGSYVAIGGTAGNAALPFNYMTRFMAGNGQLKLHTDVDPTMVGQGVSVSVTLLSAADNKTCATTVSFTVLPDVSYPTTPHPVGSTTGGTGKSGSHGGASAPEQVTPTTSVSTSTVPGTLAQTFCEGRGALWLWLTLLLVYIILTAVAALSRTPSTQKNPAIPVALILVPLILLVGFWYFSAACRAGMWVPIVLLVIAVAGLLLAFRDKKGGPLMLLATTPKPMPMPPAKPATPAVKTPAQKAGAPAANPHAQKILEKLQQVQQEMDRSKK